MGQRKFSPLDSNEVLHTGHGVFNNFQPLSKSSPVLLIDSLAFLLAILSNITEPLNRNRRKWQNRSPLTSLELP